MGIAKACRDDDDDDNERVCMLQLLEECTEKLGLHKAARRLFLEDGQEVISEDDIDRDVEVYVSTGEPFRNPIKDMLRTYRQLCFAS